jgi:hypothetical protein
MTYFRTASDTEKPVTNFAKEIAKVLERMRKADVLNAGDDQYDAGFDTGVSVTYKKIIKLFDELVVEGE